MNKLVLYIYLVLFFGYPVANAQTGNQIIIATKSTSLVLKVGTNNRVYQAYLGKRFFKQDDNSIIPNGRHEAYITGGMEDLLQPAIRLIHSDGNPSLELRYVSHTAKNVDENVSETTILLHDPKYPVQVILHYQAFNKEDIIKSWAEIKNDEKGEIKMENYASSMLHF